MRALARVRHPNVVRLYGACIEQPPCLVMAFATGGALDDAVREGRFASNAAVVTLLAGIARGMEAVHAHKIIHLDLKPENVLLSAENVPWVTDFGLSTSSNLTSMSTSSVGGRGTIYYKVSSAPRSPHPPAPGRLPHLQEVPHMRPVPNGHTARSRRHPNSSPSPPLSPPRPTSTPTPSLHGWCARVSSRTKTCNRLRRQWRQC